MRFPLTSLLAGGTIFLAAVLGCGAGGSGPPPVSGGMVARAQQQWPESSKDSLEQGRSIFTTKCKQCHSLPKPTAKTAEEWPSWIDKMGKLAELDEPRKQLVLRYLLSARDEG